MAQPTPVAARRSDERRRLPRYSANELDVPFVIQTNRERMARTVYWEEHSHPTHELLWQADGAGSVQIGRDRWSTSPNIGLWIPAGTLHSGRSPAHATTFAAHFSTTRVAPLADAPVAVEITALLSLLLQRLAEPNLGEQSRSATETLTLDVLTPARHQPRIRIPTSPLLAPIVAATLADPAQSATLQSWAQTLGTSPRTLTRAFNSETGMTFSDWVRLVRIDHACSLLARADPIDEIAQECGYQSATSFGVAFRRVMGITPGSFRRQLQP